MRYGVIADVHANLPALEAVLDALERLDVDAYACAGDLVGYGSHPNECVDLIRGLGAACVAGNHDLVALGVLSDASCERLARDSLRWTRAQLSGSTRDYLAGLPWRLELDGGVVVAHGSLDDPQEYVLNAEQAAGQRRRLAELYPDAGVLVLGHTHRVLDWKGDAWVLNPGAVGQSREARIRARFMVLDLDRREATFHAVRYDVGRARALLRASGRPTRSLHLPPWRAKAVLRPAIRVIRRVPRP